VQTCALPISSWARTNSGGTACTPCTPIVFCAVRAVMTDVPNAPNAWKVFRSAWIPAPPPLSLPAIVSAIGMAVMGSLLSGGNVAHVGGKAIGRAPWGDAAVLYRALAYQRPETRYSAGGRW